MRHSQGETWHGRPGPQVRSSVPTGGTPVPRALEDKLQPVLDHAAAAGEFQRIQKVWIRDIGIRCAEGVAVELLVGPEPEAVLPVVEGVVQLEAELDLLPLGHARVLEDGKVPVVQPG